jgi:hypothetical protein
MVTLYACSDERGELSSRFPSSTYRKRPRCAGLACMSKMLSANNEANEKGHVERHHIVIPTHSNGISIH